MPVDPDDRTAVRSIAVTAGDVVAAYEATRQAGRQAVLRVTPPFSGRMRARLHVSDAVTGAEAAAEADPGRAGPEPIEIAPGDLLADAPPYPTPDDTEDELRADPADEYTPERHRERHEAALADWREQARRSIVDSVTVESAGASHEVDVAVLGR